MQANIVPEWFARLISMIFQIDRELHAAVNKSTKTCPLGFMTVVLNRFRDSSVCSNNSNRRPTSGESSIPHVISLMANGEVVM